MFQLMYTSHPPESSLKAFAPPSLVRAAENNVSVSFGELLAMRRVVAGIAGDLEAARPDLIPFFATGGIPFMLPAMHALADRGVRDLVDGKHIHMFPGLSWGARRDGADSQAFFAEEFGRLVAGTVPAGDGLRIWTMDATFTGNAIRRLMGSLHQAFDAVPDPPPRASISLLAIIDASRARKKPEKDDIPLESSFGSLYLVRSAEFSPAGELEDGRPVRFVRNDGEDRFEIDVEYRVIGTIPTEDRAELIGAIARTGALGVDPAHVVGRLTVQFENGYSPTGTGGNGIGNNILSYLSKGEDRLPWTKWLETAALPPLAGEAKNEYQGSKASAGDTLRILELMLAATESIVEGLLAQPGLLRGVEIYCLKEHALRQIKASNKFRPIDFPGNLLRKVLASARHDADVVADALMIFRVCRLDVVAEEPGDLGGDKILDWWDVRLRRDRPAR